ncbi:MAG: TMEM165/GDT1 family protein [Candidatus Adiutrix intracellularis]|jgi:putative Ca2+/H+ antiporter (TMEM165/GDT1 family)|nr:TMEM165/GDT1 family protein [Candidatus Adiutrix intracellularis]
MNIKVMLPIFSSIFLTELGDKTQLATIIFVASDAATAGEVFLASSLALVLSTLLAVLLGAAIGRLVPPYFLKAGAGLVFIGMGGYYLIQVFGLKT